MTWYFLWYSNRISFYADDIRDSWFNNVNIYYTNIFKYYISNVEMQCLLSAESPCVWELVLQVNFFFFLLKPKKMRSCISLQVKWICLIDINCFNALHAGLYVIWNRWIIYKCLFSVWLSTEWISWPWHATTEAKKGWRNVLPQCLRKTVLNPQLPTVLLQHSLIHL